jgi:hypothetical protein
MAFRSFYCTINVFGAADFDRVLQAFKWMAIRTEQRLKKNSRDIGSCAHSFPNPSVSLKSRL